MREGGGGGHSGDQTLHDGGGYPVICVTIIPYVVLDWLELPQEISVSGQHLPVICLVEYS